MLLQGLGSPLLLPSLVPRFLASSSSELLHGLGKLAAERGDVEGPGTTAAATATAASTRAGFSPALRIHSHVSESLDDVALAAKTHPAAAGPGGGPAAFDAAGLLRPGTILAHGTQLTQHQLQLLAKRGAGIAHCPLSNFFFGARGLRCCVCHDALLGRCGPGLICALAGGGNMWIWVVHQHLMPLRPQLYRRRQSGASLWLAAYISSYAGV